MTEYIVLLDPSLRDNNGNPSYNTGDIIISESVKKILDHLFPQIPVVRISTHTWFGRHEKKVMQQAKFVFAGGSNMLTSDIRNFSRFTPEKKKFFYFFPGFKNIILLGTGWCHYEPAPDMPTRLYYHHILHQRYLQSVRDNYSVAKLKKCGLANVINTSCPTTWQIDTKFINSFDIKRQKLLFTLTDYCKNSVADARLIQMLLELDQQEITFFPQGSEDLEYLQSLQPYKQNKSKIKFIEHSYNALQHYIENNMFNYVGTRLHAGILCLQSCNPTLILGIDNRASEIGRDIHLNVTDRQNYTQITEWLQHGFIPPALNLPLNDISAWMNQFKENH